MIDARACRMLGQLVSSLGPGLHLFEYDYARVEVNRRRGATTVWLHLPNGRIVLAAFGNPDRRRSYWRCPDDDAVAYALLVLEHELGSGDEVLYVEVVGEGVQQDA